MVSNSTPDEAVLSFDITVLLTKLTARASRKETPAPSQPATLLTMMLFVRLTVFQRQPDRSGVEQCPASGSKNEGLAPCGKLTTSEPLTFCKAMPPPLPLSAWLPMIRLALITKRGPVPSLGPIVVGLGAQSWSV